MVDPQNALPSAEANPMRRYLHGKGRAPFALITGATGGMGEEWAYQLAHHGFHLIIQGRNRAKLEAVRDKVLSRLSNVDALGRTRTKRKSQSSGSSTAVENGNAVKRRRSSTSSSKATKLAQVEREPTYLAVPKDVEVELLVCEATVWPNDKLQEGLHELLERKDVRLTVVINNLGVQSEGYPRLEDLSSDETASIVIANSLFPAEVTRTCLPHLKRNGPSLLVTVTSIGAWTPTPYLSPYMGTKGFDVAFSHSLRSEMLCELAEVDVVCMVPGQVQSGMCAEPESLMVPTSFDWVRAAIASLRPGGLLGAVLPYGWLSPPARSPRDRHAPTTAYWKRPKAVITPWWPHCLGMVVAQYGPTWLLDTVAVSKVKGLKRQYEELNVRPASMKGN